MKSNVIAPVVVNTRVGAAVHKVRFVAYANRVTVTSHELPKLTIKPNGDGTYSATALGVTKRGKPVVADGKTPFQAFKKITAAAWH